MGNLKKYRLLALLFSCLLLLVLLGCGQGEKKSQTTTGKVVTDYQGKQVKLPAKPQKVVSLSVSSDEILLELLPANRIAALTSSMDRAELSNALEKAKQVKARIEPGSPESILKLQPDLVIVPDFIRPEVISTLRDTGLTVYVYHKPNSFGEIKNTIKEIAGLVGEKPEPLLNYMEQKEKLLEQALKARKGQPPKRAVYLMANGAYSNPHSPYQDICKYAGVADATMELKLGKKTFLSKEQLVKLNPEVIIVTDFNWDGKTATAAKIKAILEDPAYKNIRAVQEKQIVAIPGAHIYSLSHHIIEAAEDLAHKVYPQCFQ